MPRNYYVSGGWNVICDSCGKKIKASDAKQRWDGLVVCPEDFEMRQPQDFVKARSDKITVPFSRPRPTDVFKYTEGVYDPIHFSDTLVSSTTYNRSFGDSITVSDNSLVQKIIRAFETVVIDDGDGYYVDPTYFAQDYIYINPIAGYTISFGKNTFESLNISDVDSKQFPKSYLDSVTIQEIFSNNQRDFMVESLGVSDNVIITKTANPTDFYETVLFNDTISLHVTKSKADTITTSDSGSIYGNDYVDPTYFLEDYIGIYGNF